MSVSKKTGRKIGLITSIAIMIGSIIGIGIFFKNGSVFLANNSNGWYVLTSWIVAAIISTATAFSFCEAASSEQGNTGIGGWATKLCGHKVGYFTKFNFSFFYFGLLLTAISIFVAESIFNIFGGSGSNIHMGYIILVAIAILVVTLLLNYFSTRSSQILQLVLSSLKFVPILLIVILGLSFFGKANNNLFIWDNIDKAQTNKDMTKIPSVPPVAGILAALPAILFAFDSFTCVGSLSKEAKSKKTVPIAIIIGMVLVSLVYLSITITQILVGEGTIEKTFEKIFADNETAKIAFKYIVNIFMFASVLGVQNALTLSCIRSCEGLVNERLIAGHSWIIKVSKGKELASGTILFSFISLFWMVIIGIISIVKNHDAFADGLSNYATLFFFAIYGLVVLFTFINRFTKKVEVDKVSSYLFYPLAIISIIGISMSFGYQFFYENIARLFIDPNANSSWGVLFVPSKGSEIKIWEVSIVFFSMLIIFMIGPIINYYINKATSKSDLEFISKSNINLENDENIKDNR